MVHQPGGKSDSDNKSNLHVLDHPLAQHYLTILRQKGTEPAQFRTEAKRLTLLLALEASRCIIPTNVTVQGILEDSVGQSIEEQIIAAVILRAGLGMLDPIVEMFPSISVGYIGLERNEETAIASSYYAKLPPNCAGKTVFVLDPMLATGGSASQAITLIKAHKPREVIMISIVAAPEGVAHLHNEHPDVKIYTGAIDRELNNQKYILPGLGDFGDRLYGT